jgi:vitamin B12 transporter
MVGEFDGSPARLRQERERGRFMQASNGGLGAREARRRINRLAWASVSALAFAAAVGARAQAQDQADEAEVIVVTGSRTPIEREKIGSALTVVTGAELQLEGIQYVGDALREVPGVAVSRTGSFGGTTQIRLRGAEANHVLVLLDGVEVATADSGEVDFSSLLTGDVERIEVLRGPQSGLYGSNALAGVVNIITRRGGDGATLNAEAEAGSFETYQGRVNGSVGDGRSYLSGAYAYRTTEGFNTSVNGDEKDGDENQTVYVRGGSQLTDSFRVDANVRFVDKNSDTDGFDFSGGPDQGLSVDDDSTSETQDRNYGASAQLDLLDDRWSTMLSGFYVETEQEGMAGGFASFGGETSRSKIALQSSYTFGPSNAVSRITGFAEHEEETYLNTVPFDPSQEAEQDRALEGFGLEYRLELWDQLFLSAAARQDQNDDFDDAETVSLGASWVIGESGLRLHASYGTGVTNPTFFEQFGFVPGTFVGNPSLTPEKAEGFDFGLEQTLFDGAALFDVTFFQSTLEDEIVSLFPSVANDVGESERRGIETSFSADIAGFQLTGSYTFTDAEDPDGTDEVRRPEHMASFDVSRRFLADRLGLAAGVVYNGEMLDNDYRNYYVNGFLAEKTLVDAYALVRVSGDYQLTDRVALFGRVENALDEEYVEAIGYNTPGPAAFAGLRVTLNSLR